MGKVKIKFDLMEHIADIESLNNLVDEKIPGRNAISIDYEFLSIDKSGTVEAEATFTEID